MIEKVVQFPGTLFRLKELVGVSGKGLITVWLSAYPDARARFRIRVRNLRRVPQTQWTTNHFRYLGYGIAEIKWSSNNKEFRVLGFYREDFFVMLIGCTHKQNVYDPPECLNTARRRKDQVENGEWSTIEHEL